MKMNDLPKTKPLIPPHTDEFPGSETFLQKIRKSQGFSERFFLILQCVLSTQE